MELWASLKAKSWYAGGWSNVSSPLLPVVSAMQTLHCKLFGLVDKTETGSDDHTINIRICKLDSELILKEFSAGTMK